MKSLSRVQLFATSWIAYQTSPSTGFFRQEYQSALLFPSPVKKHECRRTDAFELWCRTLEKSLGQQGESNQSILKEINPSILIGRTDAEAKALVFWSSDANSRLIGKVPDAWKD